VAGQNPATIFIQIKIKRMANMSYCRFENTLRDLRDCFHNMDSDDLSQSEFYARKHMIELCMSIACDYVDILGGEFVEEGMFIDDEEWEKENGR
jgi:hypothetical protein